MAAAWEWVGGGRRGSSETREEVASTARRETEAA